MDGKVHVTELAAIGERSVTVTLLGEGHTENVAIDAAMRPGFGDVINTADKYSICSMGPKCRCHPAARFFVLEFGLRPNSSTKNAATPAAGDAAQAGRPPAAGPVVYPRRMPVTVSTARTKPLFPVRSNPLRQASTSLI